MFLIRKADNVMKILWLKDSKTGHLHKAKGLLRAISGLTTVEIVEYEVRWRWPGIRSFLSILGDSGLRLPVHWFLKNSPDLTDISLILSAGGSTQWPNAAMAIQFGKSNVFLGSPRQLNPNFFSLIAFHDAPSKTAPYYRFDIIPSMVTPVAAQEAANLSRLHDSRTWGILIGGDGEDIIWTEENYLVLANNFIAAAKKQGVKVRIATSRRTPPQIEIILRKLFQDSNILSDSCWYHQREVTAPSLLAMMGACSRLYVTADSMSMTHEAVSSGRPVFVILPLIMENSRLMRNLANLESSRYIVLQNILDISKTDTSPSDGWQLITGDPTLGLAQAVIAAHSRGL
jgi:mitochondrial fission protein ELM1